MKRALLVSLILSLSVVASAQQSSLNGRGASTQNPGCLAAHKDVAVNTTIALVIPAPPLQDQYLYICGWDWQVTEDATGTVQTNVLWTTTNLGAPSVAAGYSVAAVPNSMVSGNFTYPTPIRTNNTNQSVVFSSPAAALHNAYVLNVYYKYDF